MIVVKVEMWPLGDESRAYEMVRATVTNTGSGTKTRGNYRVRLYDKRKNLWRETSIFNWPRQAKHVWRLIALALGRACDADTTR